MVLGGTGSVWGGVVWYLVVLDQSVWGGLVGTWWYWVSIGLCWLVCGGNGSVWGGIG